MRREHPAESVVVYRRRPQKKRSKGGRPRKPPAHVASIKTDVRVTPTEHLVLDRVLEARRSKGLPGSKNRSDWLRHHVMQDALGLGVDLPPEYAAARSVESLLGQRTEEES